MDKKEIYWDCDSKLIHEFLNDFKNYSNFHDFRFKYDWRNYPEIEDYLLRLMYCSYARNKDIRSNLVELIHDVEDFFYQSIKKRYITENNLDRIMNSLKDKTYGFRTIDSLPEKGLYGKSIGDTIQINLNMEAHANSPTLTPRETTKMYMFHEIGHKIMNISKNFDETDKYLKTVEEILKSKGISNPDTSYKETIYHGFLMIEEALVQELAEQLTYRSANKKRPTYVSRIDIANRQGGEFEVLEVPTNLDFYGLFQEPTIEFGKTLRGCYGAYSTRESILTRMIIKALSSDFTKEVIKEYYEGDGRLYQDLFLTLRAMGILKIQKYATFGQGEPMEGITSESCLNAIRTITERNQDMRTYPLKGFKDIDYDSYLKAIENENKVGI